MILFRKRPRTNADRFRAMSDIELARVLMRAHDCELNIPFCQEKQECNEMIDRGNIIPDEKCLGCMVKWLQREAE